VEPPAPSASPWQGTNPTRRNWWLIVAATLVGGALRYFHILVAHPPGHYLFGEMLLQTNRYYMFLDPGRPFRPIDTLLPPGLMWLGSLGFKLRPGMGVEALAPYQALLSTACIPLAFIGLRRFLGARAALVGAWLLAIDPLAIGLAGFFVPDSYLAFFLLLAFALLRPGRPATCLLAGLALGAASLFGAPVLALAALWMFALWFAAKPTPRFLRKALEPRRLSAVAVALGVLAVIVPESRSLSRDSGQPVALASGAGAAFYVDRCRVRPITPIDTIAGPLPIDPMLPGSSEWPVVSVLAPLSNSAFYFREGLRCVSWSPFAAVARIVHETLNLMAGWPLGSADVWPLGGGLDLPWARAANLLVSLLLFPLALAGLWVQRRRLDMWLGFGLPALAALLLALVFGGSPQLRAGFDPFIFAAAAWAGFAAWEGRLGDRLRAFLRSPTSGPLLAGVQTEVIRPRRRPAVLAALIVSGLALSVCYPLTKLWWFEGHEWLAYLFRLFEWMRDWRDGQLFPRWAPDLAGGYGMPHFVFFAPGVFLGAGPFVLLGAPIEVALKIWMAIVGIAGGLGAFLLVRGETRRDDAALVAAVAYTFTPYRFVDLYMRGDLAEYAALCFIPLALWCYRELARCPPERRVRFALGASFSHAALLISHTIIGQWATEAIAVVALLSILPAWYRGDRKPALATAMAMAGAVGLAAFYVVPALLEKKFASLELLTNGYYTASDHLVPWELFFRFRYFDYHVDGNFWDPHGVRMPFTIGIPLAAAAGLALLCLFARAPRRRLVPGLIWWLAVALLLYLMTPSAQQLWPALPFGEYVGFPWRLLALVATFGAAAIGSSWAAAIPSSTRWRWPLALAAAAAIGVEGRHYVQAWFPMTPPPRGITATYIQRLNNELSSGEHRPAGITFMPTAARTKLAEKLPGIETLETQQPRGNEYEIGATAKFPADIDLDTFWFPGWDVDLRSGPGTPTLAQSPTGLIRIHLPVAGTYQLHVAFHHTPVRAAAELMTLFSLLLIWPIFRLGLGRWTGPRRSFKAERVVSLTPADPGQPLPS
jgi:hypothetical protein